MFKCLKDGKKEYVTSCSPEPQDHTGTDQPSPLTWSNLWLNSRSFSVWPGLELSPSVKGFLVTCNKCHPY